MQSQCAMVEMCHLQHTQHVRSVYSIKHTTRRGISIMKPVYVYLEGSLYSLHWALELTLSYSFSLHKLNIEVKNEYWFDLDHKKKKRGVLRGHILVLLALGKFCGAPLALPPNTN